MKAATIGDALAAKIEKISIHAAREGGDVVPKSAAIISIISIHAAREGGDLLKATIFPNPIYFNPRRP